MWHIHRDIHFIFVILQFSWEEKTHKRGIEKGYILASSEGKEPDPSCYNQILQELSGNDWTIWIHFWCFVTYILELSDIRCLLKTAAWWSKYNVRHCFCNSNEKWNQCLFYVLMHRTLIWGLTWRVRELEFTEQWWYTVTGYKSVTS